MEAGPSCSKDDQLCKLCNENQCRYICPKCGIPYCSIDCYKSAAHLECSEAFYKKCVEEELKVQQQDSGMKQKTLDILQRIYNEDVDEDVLKEILQENEDLDDEVELDSDDEDVPSLEQRLKNVNLDDADQLWSALTTTERQEFEALIQSGEASKLLPSWSPWWLYSSKKKLVEDITKQNEEPAYKNGCPKMLDTPALESLTKVSPFIRYSVINAVYSYAYSVLYCNGEHHTTPLDAVYIFLRLCETIRVNRIFKDNTAAVENVLLEITNCDALSGDQESITGTKEAGDSILNGPEDENKSFYILTALSDLHQLLHEAKKEISTKKSKLVKNEFKSKFQSEIDLGSYEVTKKNLTLLLKKIEFYIAWLKSQSKTYDITEGVKV